MSIDFDAAIRAAWRAFFANPASDLAKAGGNKRQWRLFQQTVVPSLAYRWSKWPPQKSFMNRLDGVQSNMIAALSNIARNPCEGIDSYMCRRGRAARGIAKKQGVWSSSWLQCAKAWHNHLQRHPESPAGMVMSWHNKQWLQEQRAALLVKRRPKATGLSLFASWTGTRTSAGRPCVRFEEGCASF